MIGQLPIEAGGNYTTGAANVVYELSKTKVDGIALFTFGTNISNKNALKISSYPNQYLGYGYNIVSFLKNAIFHPILTVKQLQHFKKVDHESPLRYYYYLCNISRAITKVHPDVIHVHSIANLSATKFALGEQKIPILLTCHGIFYRGNSADKSRRDKWLGNIGFADAYTGLTQESKQEYEQYLGIDSTHVTVVPNGVNCSKFYYSLEARKTIRESMNLKDDCIVFITVASVQQRKGQYQFVKLLKKLKHPYQYWIIGKGEDESLIKHYISENGMEDNVKLFGFKEPKQLYQYYSAADIYAHVSEKEGQALSELEANATGLRTIVNKKIIGTIANDETSPSYFVLDFDHIDSKELIQWITNGICNQRNSNHSYSWSVIAEKYAQLYRRFYKNYKK